LAGQVNAGDLGGFAAAANLAATFADRPSVGVAGVKLALPCNCGISAVDNARRRDEVSLDEVERIVI
jgi:hypothetical protein